MTLEEIINKINGLNSKLDDYILGIQFQPSKFDYNDLFEGAKSIERVILDDPAVKAVLSDRTNEQRQEYLDAIKQGTQKAKEILKKFKESEKDINRKKEIDKVEKNAYKNVENVISGIEELEKTDSKVALSDDYRKKDLARKIQLAEYGIEMKEKFGKIRKSLKDEGLNGYVDEAIDEVKYMQTVLENYKDKKLEIINLDSSGGPTSNLFDEVQKYKELIKNGANLKDDKVQEVLKAMKDLAIKTDEIDDYDLKDTSMLAAQVKMPFTEDGMKDENIIKEWIEDLENKSKKPEFLKKLKLDPEFLNSRREAIDRELIEKFKASPVFKNLDTDILKEKVSHTKLEEYLKRTLDGLKAFEKFKGKDTADIKRYIADAKKLLEAYETSTSSVGEATVNGKTRDVSADITDENQKGDILAEIKALPKEDEFKAEFENKALALAGTRPTNRWYHKLLSFVTFGRYITPEDKYEVRVQLKRREIVTDIIKENKNKREQADEQVKYDKDLYYKAATQQIITKKQKLSEKARNAIINDREKNDPLTR